MKIKHRQKNVFIKLTLSYSPLKDKLFSYTFSLHLSKIPNIISKWPISKVIYLDTN